MNEQSLYGQPNVHQSRIHYQRAAQVPPLPLFLVILIPLSHAPFLSCHLITSKPLLTFLPRFAPFPLFFPLSFLQGGHYGALYELAVVSFQGLGVPPNCEHAAALVRKILDRTILKDADLAAYREYNSGRFGRSLIRYEMAADQGSLLAQQNSAWMYEMRFGTDGPAPIEPSVSPFVRLIRFTTIHQGRPVSTPPSLCPRARIQYELLSS